MKKFFGNLVLSSVLGFGGFFLLKYLISKYKFYDNSIEYFLTQHNNAILIFISFLILIYILEQYKTNKFVNFILKFLIFCSVGVILFASLNLLSEINIYNSIFITGIFLVSILLIFSFKPFLQILASIFLVFDIGFLTLLLFPSYETTVNLETVFAHQRNILILNNQTNNLKNNSDQIKVSCFFGESFGNKVDFYDSDFEESNGYVLLPLQKNINCKTNTNLKMISRNNKVFDIGSGKIEIQEQRNFDDIDKSILKINGKNFIGTSSGNEIESFIYKNEFFQTSKKLFSWKFTDKENLEKLEYRKLFFIPNEDIFFKKDKQNNFESFIKYRILVGKNIPQNTDVDIENLLGKNLKPRFNFILPPKNTGFDVFKPIKQKESFDEIKKTYNGVGKTKFLKKIGF